jgi:predicted DNA-binding ribbon-helix-helix protein
LIMVLVDRLVDRMSAIRVIVMSWLRSRPDT